MNVVLVINEESNPSKRQEMVNSEQVAWYLVEILGPSNPYCMRMTKVVQTERDGRPLKEESRS